MKPPEPAWGSGQHYDVAEVTSAAEAAARSNPEIMAVYLFGSWVDAMTPNPRDIDVALLLRPEAPELSCIERFLGSMTENGIEAEYVDVSVIDREHPMLAGEVLTSGREVFVKDRKHLADFVARTLPQYFDLRYKLSQLREERFGGQH